MHFILLQISLLVALVFTQATNGQNLQAWRYTTQLDKAGKYNLTIDVDLDIKVVKFEASVDTPDWIGLGISLNPNMVGADIYIGRNNESNGDYFVNSTANTRPLPDDGESDWITTKFSKTGNITVLGFQRNFAGTGTTQDREIKDENIYLIWAYGASNTSDTTNTGFLKHEPNSRGSKQINLLRAPTSCPNSGSRVHQFSTVFFSFAVYAVGTLIKFH